MASAEITAACRRFHLLLHGLLAKLLLSSSPALLSVRPVSEVLVNQGQVNASCCTPETDACLHSCQILPYKGKKKSSYCFFHYSGHSTGLLFVLYHKIILIAFPLTVVHMLSTIKTGLLHHYIIVEYCLFNDPAAFYILFGMRLIFKWRILL